MFVIGISRKKKEKREEKKTGKIAGQHYYVPLLLIYKIQCALIRAIPV